MSRSCPPPTVAEVRAALDYDPDTGRFAWRIRADKNAQWNSRLAGKPAGCVFRKPGCRTAYVVIGLNGRYRKAHRLAWLYMKGEWPAVGIDHRDTDGLNNRLENLRLATVSQNNANAPRPCNNSTGYKGVSWLKARRKYQAQIQCKGKKQHLGLFDRPEDAHEAYVCAAYGLFGEYARVA